MNGEKIIPYLKDAVALPGYSLSLIYEDDTRGVIDLSGWVGKGVFEYWNNLENFRGVKINKMRKLEWTDDIDMDPDAFYLEIIGKTFEEYARDKQILRHTH